MTSQRKTNKVVEVITVTTAGMTAVAALCAAILGQGGMPAFFMNGSSKGGDNPSANAEKTHVVIADGRDFTQNYSSNNGNSNNTNVTGGNATGGYVENSPIIKGSDSYFQINTSPQEQPSMTYAPTYNSGDSYGAQTINGNGNSQVQGNGNTTNSTHY